MVAPHIYLDMTKHFLKAFSNSVSWPNTSWGYGMF